MTNCTDHFKESLNLLSIEELANRVKAIPQEIRLIAGQFEHCLCVAAFIIRKNHLIDVHSEAFTETDNDRTMNLAYHLHKIILGMNIHTTHQEPQDGNIILDGNGEVQ
jgi:hypothetical protein